MAFRLPADPSLRSYTDGSALCDSCVTHFYAEPRFASLVGGVTVHFTCGQWKQAVADGCPLCSLVLERLDAAFPGTFADMDSDQDLELTLKVKKWVKNFLAGHNSPDWTEGLGYLEIDLFYSDEYNPIHLLLVENCWEVMVLIADIGNQKRQTTTVKELTQHADDAAGSIVKVRDDALDLRRLDSLLEAFSLLCECATTHHGCQLPIPCNLGAPTRLLQVSGTPSNQSRNDLKLVLTNTMDKLPPYLALSYCWGGPQNHKTELKNHNERLSGFSSSQLDRTIRDAVEVTRAMHVEYLWVDAHCIIQDSDEDKLHEIANMGDIFRRAHATIIVEAASAASEGFLSLHDRRPCTSIPFRCSEDIWGTLQVHNVSRRPIAFETRAWTLQEVMFSRRHIIFGRNTVSWNCTEQQSNDVLRSQMQLGFLSSRAIAPVYHGLIVETDLGKDLLTHHYQPGLWGAHSEVSFWIKVIHEYSGRALTVEQDKLLAISSWASHIGLSLSWTYLAGLWREWLELGLCWRMTNHHGLIFFGPKPRPKTYIAPSWSWASVTGQCEWCPPFHEEKEFKLLCRVEHVQVDLHDAHAIYGRLTGGSLTISAPLVTIDFLFGKQPFDLGLGIRMRHNPLTVSIYPDSTESCDKMDGDICFLILARRRSSNHQIEMWQRYKRQQQEAGKSCENDAVSDLEAAIWTQYKDTATLGRCEIVDATNLVNCEGMILVSTTENDIAYRRIGYFDGVVRSATLKRLERRITVVI